MVKLEDMIIHKLNRGIVLSYDDIQSLTKSLEQLEKVERYEKALRQIASANNQSLVAMCPKIAKETLRG